MYTEAGSKSEILLARLTNATRGLLGEDGPLHTSDEDLVKAYAGDEEEQDIMRGIINLRDAMREAEEYLNQNEAFIARDHARDMGHGY
jgi:hypothetical protein